MAQGVQNSSIVGNEEFNKAVKVIEDKGYKVIEYYELNSFKSRLDRKTVVRIETKTLFADGTTRKEVQNGY